LTPFEGKNIVYGGIFMEQNKKNTLLLTAAVIGFVYGVLLSIFVGGSWEAFVGEWGLSVVFFIVVIPPSILNLIGWKKNSKIIIIISIILYFLTVNTLPLLLCVIGILWDSNDEFGIQEKKKNPLFIIAGILGIMSLFFWFVPFMKRADGTGSDSIYSELLSGVINPNATNVKFEINPNGTDLLRIIGINYIITLFISFIMAMPITLFGELRNNSKKVLIAAISFIFSLSIPSAVLCFIAYAEMKIKKAIRKAGAELEANAHDSQG